MELWIRSQDRKVLTQVKELYVTTYSEEKGYGIYDLPDEVDDTDVPLGFYKSKERALEVLDEIEDLIYTEIDIKNSLYEHADIEVKSKILCNMTKIFVMPKE